MVNFGLNWSSLLGIILVVAGAGLYFVRNWRPKLARDHDIFFAAVGLLCGGILLFQGWRLDPILAFGQFMLTGTAIFFAVESVNLRGKTTAQAKGRMPVVDEDRPVSRQYAYEDAELEELEPVSEYPVNRRIRGSSEARSSRSDGYEDEYRGRSSGRNGGSVRPETDERPRRRKPRSDDRPPEPNNDWEEDRDRDDLGYRGREGRSSTTTKPPDRSTPPKRRRPPDDRRPRPDDDATPADYVEYRPVDYPDDAGDNSTNFDQ